MCQRCDDFEDEDQETGRPDRAEARWAGTVPYSGFGLIPSVVPGYDSGHDVLQAVDRVLTANAGRRGIVTVRVEFEDTQGVFPGQTYQEIATGTLFAVQSITAGLAYSERGYCRDLYDLADPDLYLVVHGA